MERLPSVLRLAELDRIGLDDGILYRPIARRLGVSAFGINAYTAAAAGDLVIEPHDEMGTGSGKHEELYVVVSGSATFELDGEEFDAPAGTIVFARPDQHRGARAAAPDTTVLVIGGKPGAAGPAFTVRVLVLGRSGGRPGPRLRGVRRRARALRRTTRRCTTTSRATRRGRGGARTRCGTCGGRSSSTRRLA